jgi:hypothetical protein
MASNFKETKIALETMFQENWLDTSIHYANAKFNSDDIDKWINVVYEPSRTEITSVNSLGSSISYGNLYVVCWAETQFDVSDLVDMVEALVSDYLPSDLFKTSYEIIDQGNAPNSKAFMVASFRIKSYISVC